MTVRLAMPEDAPQVLAMALHMAECAGHQPPDRATMRGTFVRAIHDADPTLFVDVEGDEVVGFIACGIRRHAFAAGVFTTQELWYVRPDKRGTRAAARLLKQFISWSEMLQATDMLFGVPYGIEAERAARLIERLTGARRCGVMLRKAL